VDSLRSVPPFVRLKKNIEECEKKNDVLQGNSEVLTPYIWLGSQWRIHYHTPKLEPN
jgi:hypothetical protein